MRLLPLLTLLATATAAPNPVEKRVNACGISSFSADASDPAYVSDCEQLVSQLNGIRFPAGWPGFEIDRTWTPFAVASTCAFYGRSTRASKAYVGNEDVYDLLRDTLRSGRRGDSVGAKGKMQCNGQEVEWRVGRFTTNPSTTITIGKREVEEEEE